MAEQKEREYELHNINDLLNKSWKLVSLITHIGHFTCDLATDYRVILLVSLFV